ncbi:Uncharacterized protein Rs2_07853 [Raphanus sativus]|nr:Uncharacterized protein Rs2_07853 [Raphanus sativus]
MAKASDFSKGLLQSEELYKYILETSVYPREPEALKELRRVTHNHPMATMATAPDAGQLMEMLLNLVNARKTIEVGVFTGYSLLLTALALPEDGKVIAIDVNRSTYELGLPVIKKAGVEHKIDFRESEALPVLDELLNHKENEGGFDFAFVDADKVSYLKYHERLVRLIKVGGIIVYDNTLWGGSVAEPYDSSMPEGKREAKKTILELNKKLSADQRVQISQAALGDGAFRESNSGPLAPKARIIPLDQTPSLRPIKSTRVSSSKPLNASYKPPSHLRLCHSAFLKKQRNRERDIKKMSEKKGRKEEVVTREYTINLHRRLHSCTFKKKAPKAIKEIRKFAEKAMGTKDVRVDVKLNKQIWSKGIRGPPRRIRVRVARKRNDDEDAKEEFFSLVTVAEIPAEGLSGLGTKVIDEED